MKRNWKNNTFKTYAESVLVGTKAQRDESGGSLLLGDNTGSRMVMLRPIRFQCAGDWILTGLPRTYTKS